jgi:4-azaleucine resistance transporter AzlC
VHEDLRAGLRDSIPFYFGVVPFGMITGIAAIETGLSIEQAVVMSLIVFAGASQLAAFELLRETAPLAVVIGTAVVINLRMLMYSASIAPYLTDYSRRARAAMAHLLVDQVYAMSVAEFSRDRSRDRFQYYAGLGLATWAGWVAATAVGALLGAGVPSEFELSFTVPLVFIALLVPTITDRPTAAAAVVSGAGATVAVGAPFNLGLFVGSTAGIVAGLLVEAWRGGDR